MKRIPDYPNYAVTEDGRVYSYVSGRYLKPQRTSHKYNHRSYLTVQISNEGGVRHHRVHRLVAMTFIPNPDNFPLINHIDSNPMNNHYKNLEWCTAKQNAQHSIRARRHQAYKNRKLSDEQVKEVRKLFVNHKPAQIAKLLGIGRSSVNDIVFGRTYREVV